MRPIKESVLLTTSSSSDVQNSGGYLNITGLKPVKKSNITSIKQIKYKAEVPQVVTVGATAYTPDASTVYAVEVYDPLRTQAGYQESPKVYKYKTPATITDIGANAAAQREYITGKLVTAINADASNHAVAVTLGGGNGFTVTDGGYYPYRSQTMTNVRGANTVRPLTNPDGSGFASTNYSITTAAVYAFGVGASLAGEAPVVDAMHGNLISGTIDTPPLTPTGGSAVSGQKYDAFVILSLKEEAAHNVSGQLAYVPRTQTVYVDNGTGSATTNLTGFKSFERLMLMNLFDLYKNDHNSIIYMGNTGVTCGGLATGLPSGTANAENVMSLGNGFTAHYASIGTSTNVALITTNDGINLVLDATASEGVEVSAPTFANSVKSFIVGKTGFSIYTKVKIDDVSGLNPYWCGFRKKEAYNSTYTSYDTYAFVGLGNGTGDIYTSIELAGGGNTNTDTTVNWADGETHTLEVRVDANGVVTFFVDAAQVNASTSLTITAGMEIIPVFGFGIQTANIGTPFVLEMAAVADDSWRA